MGSPTDIKSPAVGSVLEILVSPGDAVTTDQELLIIESMKVEIPVVAPRDGTVASLAVAEKDQVAENDTLLTLS